MYEHDYKMGIWNIYIKNRCFIILISIIKVTVSWVFEGIKRENLRESLHRCEGIESEYIGIYSLTQQI